MLKASYSGDNAAIEALVASGVSVNVTTDEGYTPLILAAGERREDTVKLLLQLRADPGLVTHDGCSALIMLTEIPEGRSGADIVGANITRLLLSGAGQLVPTNPSSQLCHRDCNGLDPLCAAIYHGNAAVAQVMIEFGADPNRRVQDEQASTPLMLCFVGSAKGSTQTQLVQMLLTGRANTYCEDSNGDTVIHYCVLINATQGRKARLDLMRMLQEHDDDSGDDLDIETLKEDELFLTSLCMHRRQENAAIGRHETDEQVFRWAASSEEFTSALATMGILREDHNEAIARIHPTAQEVQAQCDECFLCGEIGCDCESE